MLAVEARQECGSMDGATGEAPLVIETCDERSTCQIGIVTVFTFLLPVSERRR